MADNIKIIGNINDIQRIDRLNSEDLNLLSSKVKNQIFGFENDYIEFFIYDAARNLIDSNYNCRNFKLPPNSFLTSNNNLPLIEIDPINDLQSLGYISGEFITQYNFQTRKISSPDAELFISEVSEDRTEIRINSLLIPSNELLNYGNELITELNTTTEQKYFLLNLTNNTQFLVINVATDIDTSSILLKLYEPLPQNISQKTSLWITEEIIEPYVFNLNLDTLIIPTLPNQLRGPNFSIDVDTKQNVATKYENYSSLVSSLTGSSYHQVLNYINDKSYDLNINYTTFNNFIHFSSAKTRLKIFYDKIKQIEGYNNDIDIISISTSLLRTQQTSSIQQKINNIISKFDGFESYLYFESSSYAWPKSNNTKPYTLSSINSATSMTWFDNYTGSAELYDDNNLDRLYNIIPNYVKNDPANYQSYYNFIDMIGHYFDNIWIYISSINDLYNADNNLEKGISKDIVYDALKSLGVKLYNSKGNNNLTDYVSGLNSGSSLFIDDFSTTSSFLNNVPKKDQLAELYKRIYHNIPLLSKTKGTSAGLQNLMTTFGVTSSIFSPKEFGGSTKINEIKGYDNDKITIQNNTITGSVLSSFISLQQSFTGSNDFTSTDLHFVDLSFSPQNQLNSRISASIAITAPTFSLDEYIGDPRLYSSSLYSNLDVQKDRFISASAAISGSAKRLDYKGFFELVKYFDNSLFKMLKDFVPARTNALTGITIKSPVLERNKIATYRPNVTEQTIYDAKFNGPVISEDNDYIYDKLTGTKSSFYDGTITGSYINVYNYFTDSNPNPYLFPTSSIDINQFNHTDFNITLNNISSSVRSTNRYKLENIYTNKDEYILKSSTQYSSSAELQDSYNSLLGHNRSRYDGTKLSSATYNTYTSASLNYNGDISYGKTAAIDHNTRKIGLFTQMIENIFLPSSKKNNVALRYLVDENGNLTELNRNNKHWHEVQNTFKSGDNLIVSLFNNQKIDDQKTTDGSKLIFDSGYNYSPMLYFSGSESTINFEYAGDNVNKIFQAKNNIAISSGPVGYISGSSGKNDSYPLIASGTLGAQVIYNAFDIIESNDGNFFTAGSAINATYPSYLVPSNGSYTFSSEFDIYVDLKAPSRNISFRYEVFKGNSNGEYIAGSAPFTTPPQKLESGYSVSQWNIGSNILGLGNLTISVSRYAIPPNYLPLTLKDDNSQKIVILTPFTPGFGSKFNGDDGNVYYLFLGTYTYGSEDYSVTQTRLILSIGSEGNKILPNDYILYETSEIDFPSNLTGTLSFRLNATYNDLTANDRVFFKLIKESSNTSDFTASFSTTGKLRNNLISTTSGTFVTAVGTTSNHLISSSISLNDNGNADGNFNAIVLNNSLTNLENYQFTAGQGLADSKALYSKYGYVNEIFSPSPGDVAVIYWDNQNVELVIKSLSYDPLGKRSITFTTNLPSSLKTKLNSTQNQSTGGVDIFLLLKRNPDETNILLKFNKKEGPTSVGIIIPSNLHPDVLANIDTITKEVKQKLIDFGTDSGGTF